jgi:hypothetical protein
MLLQTFLMNPRNKCFEIEQVFCSDHTIIAIALYTTSAIANTFSVVVTMIK